MAASSSSSKQNQNQKHQYGIDVYSELKKASADREVDVMSQNARYYFYQDLKEKEPDIAESYRIKWFGGKGCQYERFDEKTFILEFLAQKIENAFNNDKIDAQYIIWLLFWFLTLINDNTFGSYIPQCNNDKKIICHNCHLHRKKQQASGLKKFYGVNMITVNMAGEVVKEHVWLVGTQKRDDSIYHDYYQDEEGNALYPTCNRPTWLLDNKFYVSVSCWLVDVAKKIESIEAEVNKSEKIPHDFYNYRDKYPRDLTISKAFNKQLHLQHLVNENTLELKKWINMIKSYIPPTVLTTPSPRVMLHGSSCVQKELTFAEKLKQQQTLPKIHKQIDLPICIDFINGNCQWYERCRVSHNIPY